MNPSPDLHVGLFRAHFMRVFLRCLRAPGCSRTNNDHAPISSQPVHVQDDPIGEGRNCVFIRLLRWSEPGQTSLGSAIPDPSDDCLGPTIVSDHLAATSDPRSPSSKPVLS